MPIEPAVAAWLETSIRHFSGIRAESIADRRAVIQAAYEELMAAYPVDSAVRLSEVRSSTDTIEVGGTPVVALRFHRPPIAEPAPALIHLFGGAWWQRTFDAPDIVDTCRQMALDAGVIVVQVDYALAPEHPFPAALEQAYAALAHVAGLPAIDPSRIAVGGISAGANLAAALCLLARDRGGPAIRSQLLEVPVLDLTLERYDETAHDEFPVVEGVERASAAPLREAISWYLGDVETTHPLASPLHADDLSGLPEALILTAAHDPLWLEGRDYAEALSAAGTVATGVQFAGQIHSAPTLGALSTSARLWRAATISMLRRL